MICSRCERDICLWQVICAKAREKDGGRGDPSPTETGATKTPRFRALFILHFSLFIPQCPLRHAFACHLSRRARLGFCEGLCEGNCSCRDRRPRLSANEDDGGRFIGRRERRYRGFGHYSFFIFHSSFLNALSVTASRATSPRGRGFGFCGNKKAFFCKEKGMKNPLKIL